MHFGVIFLFLLLSLRTFCELPTIYVDIDDTLCELNTLTFNKNLVEILRSFAVTEITLLSRTYYDTNSGIKHCFRINIKQQLENAGIKVHAIYTPLDGDLLRYKEGYALGSYYEDILEPIEKAFLALLDSSAFKEKSMEQQIELYKKIRNDPKRFNVFWKDKHEDTLNAFIYLKSQQLLAEEFHRMIENLLPKENFQKANKGDVMVADAQMRQQNSCIFIDNSIKELDLALADEKTFARLGITVFAMQPPAMPGFHQSNVIPKEEFIETLRNALYDSNERILVREKGGIFSRVSFGILSWMKSLIPG